MRAGVVPEEVCERCNDIWGTQRRSGLTLAAAAGAERVSRRR